MTTALPSHTPDDAGLRRLAESAGDLLSRHAPDGVYRYASPAAARLLGYEPGELVGRPVFELFHPDELALARQAHEVLRQSGLPTIITHRLRAKDGSYLWFECSVRAIHDPVTGEVQEIHSVTRDVTRRRQAEERLRESEARYRAVLDGLAVGVVVHAANAGIVLANRAARDLLGASEGQLQGLTAFNPYWLLLGEDERPLAPPDHPAMVALQTARPVWDRVVGVTPAAGGITWLVVNAVPSVGGDGRATQVVVSLSDVTAVRRRAMVRAGVAGATDGGALLHGLVSICAQCKRTRDDHGDWRPVEEYLWRSAGIECSHSICPTCAALLFPDVMDQP